MQKLFGSSKFTNILLLIIAFLLVTIIGRYFLQANNTEIINSVSDSSLSSQASSSAQSTQQQARDQKDTAVSTSTVQPKTTQPLSCQDQIKADLAAKKQSYAKGQILVTFKAGQTYNQVKDVLAVYGLVVQNENNSKESFAARRLITAAVAPNQEIARVCQLRDDSHVQHASLDIYFTLHQ
jgi:cytoskeletal protein RodZ